MRSRDWSSDLCSSDLMDACGLTDRLGTGNFLRMIEGSTSCLQFACCSSISCGKAQMQLEVSLARSLLKPRRWANSYWLPTRRVLHSFGKLRERSEERRVGKECVSTGRSGWGPN